MADVSTPHPEYIAAEPDWKLMRDAVDGERAVKAEGETYLPKPDGFNAMPDGGVGAYDAYVKRAQFPEIAAPAILAMVGVIHQSEIAIHLPKPRDDTGKVRTDADGNPLSGPMDSIWESATADGMPLEVFHRRITAEILTTGRFGILVGASSSGSEVPYLVGYSAESLINWDEARDFFVLDESGRVRDGFEWKDHKKYRVLELHEGVYHATVYEGDSLAKGEPVTPTVRGGAKMKSIPFVVIGPRDLSLTPVTPPLIGVARSAIAIYQLSADYRWSLFGSGQETLFVFGGDAPEHVGAGVVVSIKGDGDGNLPDAKYVGPSGTGIAAHRQAILDEANNAANAGARLFNSEGGTGQESGEARKIRYTAETASLMSVAQASCSGLERALRYIGTMMGLRADQIEEIIVEPPKTLVDRRMTPQEMAAIMQLWEKSLISGETAYGNLQEGGIASPERSWEDELELIDEEDVGLPRDRDEADALVVTPN